MKYYAVIDTNVLVSYLLTHNLQSSVSRLLHYIPEGNVVPLYNVDILNEYVEVLHREHFHFKEEEISYILSSVKKHGLNCERKAVNEIFPDPSDAVFYEVTMSRDDSYLVTGNLKHFPKSKRVVSPAEMLEIMKYGEDRPSYLSDVEDSECLPMTIDEINAIIREVREEIKGSRA